MPLALEIGAPIQAEAARKCGKFLRCQPGLDLGDSPNVELPLMTFRVRIEAGIKASLMQTHVAQRPVGGFPGDLRKQRLSGRQRRPRVFAEQLAIVVEHFLEVGDHPPAVDGVARETAAQLVVQAALGHACQRQTGHVQRLEIRDGFCGRAVPMPQAALDAAGMRELRGSAEPAEISVERSLESRARLVQWGWLQGDVAGRRFRLESRECEFQLLVLGGDLRTMAAVILGHAPQQIAERRHAVARLLRKVRAPKERCLLARSQEHG